MNRMPLKLRAELEKDPWYKICCITGDRSSYDSLTGVFERIEWHHNLMFAGKQVQEKFSILPVLSSVHKTVHLEEMKARLDWIMWNRASDEQIKRYSKSEDYMAYRDYLNEVYGEYIPYRSTHAGIAYHR